MQTPNGIRYCNAVYLGISTAVGTKGKHKIYVDEVVLHIDDISGKVHEPKAFGATHWKSARCAVLGLRKGE
jgi:hypothetical protein